MHWKHCSPMGRAMDHEQVQINAHQRALDRVMGQTMPLVGTRLPYEPANLTSEIGR
jgi:hypothetical protein